MLAQKTRKSRLWNRCKRQLRNDDHLTQLQSHGSGLATEVCEVVFVASADLFDDTMDPQAFEQTSNLTGGFVGKILAAQLLVGETADAKLALQQGTEQTGILFREEIEALVTVVVLMPPSQY